MNRSNLQYALDILRSEAKLDPNFFKKEVFSFRSTTLDNYKKLLEEVKLAHEGKDKQEKGKKLEEAISFVFDKTDIYSSIERLRDNSNEIDLLLKLNDLGNIFFSFDVKDLMPDVIKNNKNIICECKNVASTVGVTWVGKFFSLLQQRNLKLGIIISYKGLAGKGEWDSAKGLVKKIYLKHEIAILDISYEDLKKLAEINELGRTTSIIELIESKFDNLVYQTDLDRHKSKHPAE